MLENNEPYIEMKKILKTLSSRHNTWRYYGKTCEVAMQWGPDSNDCKDVEIE